jgi:predicted nucleic acid-binding protein
MKTAIDSNILSALWSNEPGAVSIAEMLREASQLGVLLLSPIAYTELFAFPKATGDFIHGFLETSAIQVDMEPPTTLWPEAGRRFALYAARRRRSGGGEVRRLAADFVVGTHALLQADRLMTMDTRYQRDFPELNLYLVKE